jgi:hypothetical protein
VIAGGQQSSKEVGCSREIASVGGGSSEENALARSRL